MFASNEIDDKHTKTITRKRAWHFHEGVSVIGLKFG